MPRFAIGHVKRTNTSFTCDPEVLKQAQEKAGRTPLSSIIEDFLKQWIAGKIEVSPPETTPGQVA